MFYFVKCSDFNFRNNVRFDSVFKFCQKKYPKSTEKGNSSRFVIIDEITNWISFSNYLYSVDNLTRPATSLFPHERHLGAHYWLAKTDYNYGIIAEVGGWHTIDELKKSYGQIPPEIFLEIIL